MYGIKRGVAPYAQVCSRAVVGMVLILDGNSEIGAHMTSNLYWIFFRFGHKSDIFFSK